KKFDDVICTRGNFLLVGLPRSGKTELLKASSTHDNVVDLASLNVIGEPDVADAKDHLILDHFEHSLEERSSRLIKLEFLEKMMFQKRRQIFFVTTIDPKFYFE